MGRIASARIQATTPEQQGDEGPDRPLIDSTNQAVKKVLARAKERGYVTYDEINTALPQDKVSSEQIEDTMAMLSEMGVNVVENEEAEEQSQEAITTASVPATTTDSKEVTTKTKEELARTDDPVTMYLREMGPIELREIVDLDATYGRGPGAPGNGTDATPASGNGVDDAPSAPQSKR